MTSEFIKIERIVKRQINKNYCSLSFHNKEDLTQSAYELYYRRNKIERISTKFIRDIIREAMVKNGFIARKHNKKEQLRLKAVHVDADGCRFNTAEAESFNDYCVDADTWTTTVCPKTVPFRELAQPENKFLRQLFEAIPANASKFMTDIISLRLAGHEENDIAESYGTTWAKIETRLKRQAGTDKKAADAGQCSFNF